jgi:hypothetical protein
LSARSAWAGEFTLTPRLELTQEYNDNILFSSKNTIGDAISRVAPELHGSYGGENYSLTGGGFLRAWEYWDENDLDTVDQFADLSATIQPTQRLEGRVSGTYLKDTTLESELEATGLVLARTNRRWRNGSGSLVYGLGERTSLEVGADYTGVSYADPDFVDYTGYVYTGNLTHLAKNERDVFMAAFYAADYRFSPDETPVLRLFSPDETQIYGLTLGFQHPFTEQVSLDLAGGVRFVRSQIETLGGTLREEDWGGLGNIALSWTTEKSNARVGYVHEVTPSGLGEVIEKYRPYIRASYRFSEKLTGELYSEYFDSKSLGDLTRIDENFFRVRPSLTVRITEKISARLVYEYARSRDKLADTRADRNLIYLALIGTWPKKYHAP